MVDTLIDGQLLQDAEGQAHWPAVFKHLWPTAQAHSWAPVQA
jgi:hypothetical protein